MAKSAREIVGLVCETCKSQNYTTMRNKTNMDVKGIGKLEIKKYCSNCKKHTIHKEKQKLK